MGAGHSNDEPRAVYAAEGGISKRASLWRTMSDEDFAADCDFEAFRASGPGGQKRNKTSSAVRLTHRPSGESAIASESRSQHDNRRAALRRLRHRVVVHCREPITFGAFATPEWFETLKVGGRIDIGPKSELYLPLVGLILDVLAAGGWSVSEAARSLGMTTSALVVFLQADQKVMTHVNQSRVALGLKTLGTD